MSDSHNHSHQNPVDSFKQINFAFYLGIGLNLAFTIVEFILGYFYDSLVLLADATHNLSDVASLVISMIGMRLAQKAATLAYTYGYKKASLFASFINAVLLIVIVFGIVYEAIERFSVPMDVPGLDIVWVAGIGVLVNSVSAYFFYKGRKSDINIKAAFLHLALDALVSVGVMISGLVIYYTKWNIVDPIVSLILGVVILLSTWRLFAESLKLMLDGVPKNIDLEKISKLILNIDGVESLHHIHVWALSSTINALTCHIKIKNESASWENIKKQVKHLLADNNIQHVTLELDTPNEICEEEICQ